MIRTEHLIETRDADLVLSETEAAALSGFGARLAARKLWWGASDDAQDTGERSVVQVRPLGGGRWRVRVVDAVGVISVGSLQLVIGPKIPPTHLLFLLEKSGVFPRLDHAPAAIDRPGRALLRRPAGGGVPIRRVRPGHGAQPGAPRSARVSRCESIVGR